MALGGQLIQEPDAIHYPNLQPNHAPPQPQDSSMVEALDFSSLLLESSPPATLSLHPPSPCANCDCCGSGAGNSNSSSGSRKRPPLPPSTSTSSSLVFPHYDPQPKPKKLFLDPNDAVVVSAANPPALPAPVEHSGQNPVFLRRCASDPYHAPLAPAYQSPPDSFPGSGSGSGIFLNTSRSPENVVKTNNLNSSVTPCSAPLPPRRQPTLRRCVSNPISSPAKSFSRTSSSTDLEKTANPEKLRQMWHCWKEINSKMEEFMSEEQEEENDNEENNEANTTDQLNDIIQANKASNPQEEDSEIECEESLSVERTGEGLTVRFKCNCGRAYEFLFPGGKCYYKLL